jgi:hypothetical protein
LAACFLTLWKIGRRRSYAIYSIRFSSLFSSIDPSRPDYISLYMSFLSVKGD